MMRIRILAPLRQPIRDQLKHRRFWLAIAVLVGLTRLLSSTELIDRAGLMGINTYQALEGGRDAKLCKVVGISTSCWQRYFAGLEPLPPKRLLDAISTIARYRPALIVVDILTEGSAYVSLPNPNTNCPIVWARSVDSHNLAIGRVLGSSVTAPEYSGLPLFIADRDGIVRRYRRFWNTSEREPELSLSWAAVRAYCHDHNYRGCPLSTELTEDQPSFDLFLGNYREFAGSATIQFEDLVNVGTSGVQPDNLLRNKIVVLGANYGTDRYLTSSGMTWGAGLIAAAIESDLHGMPLRPIPEWLAITLEVSLGILIALVHHNFAPKVAMCTMLVIMTATMFGGFFAYLWSGYWSNFVLIGFGIWIEQLYEAMAAADKYAEVAAMSLLPNAISSKQPIH